MDLLRCGIVLAGSVMTAGPWVACGTGGDASAPPGSGDAGGGSGGGPAVVVEGGPACAPGLEGCATSLHSGEALPLDMFVVLDRSASMADGGKWDAATRALRDFLTSPGALSLSVGLGFFPVPPTTPLPTTCATDADCGAYGPCFIFPPFPPGCLGALGGDSCLGADYEAPAVAIAPLSVNADPLVRAIDAADPLGSSTTTQAALQGAIAYVTRYAAGSPGRVPFIVLATDGLPQGCNDTVQGIAQIAADALAAPPFIRTFVIGVGGELSALNEIAFAGGTRQAFLATGQGGDILAALEKIQIAALCNFGVPTPASGIPDPGLVNVTFTAGGTCTPFRSVAERSGCGDGVSGWFYDDPGSPSQIVLCPETCDDVTRERGIIEVVVGCETIIQ